MKPIESYWLDKNWVSLGLWPMSILFRGVSWGRRALYRLKLKSVYQAPVPVIIVGNISVGGTGKTPLVAWLANYLRQAGYHPGIVSRGYRGKAKTWPQSVTADSDPWLVGDEPVYLAEAGACPVMVAADRPQAVKQLLKEHDCDIILADDGLQHYALARDIEIAVVDAERRFSNGFCLPAGPLREPISRLKQVDFVISNGECKPALCKQQHTMLMTLTMAQHLLTKTTKTLTEWSGKKIHAVAGIGFPQRFFQALRAQGLTIIEHPFLDHHGFTQQDLRFGDDLPVLMTSKDAVKCKIFASEKDWYAPVTLTINPEFGENILKRLKEIKHG